MSFWIGLEDEGSWAVPKHHMIPDKYSKENLGKTLGQHRFVFQNILMPHAALGVLALEVSAGKDHMHVENTEPCLQWQSISGDPIAWLLAQCLYSKVTVKSRYYFFFS